MKPFELSATGTTPDVHFSSETGVLKIKGICIPDQSTKFYQPILKWFEEYAETQKDTELHIQFEYYNSATKKFVVDLLALLKKIRDKGKKGEFHWYYDEGDDEEEDAGIIFGEILGIKTVLHELKEEE